MIHATGKVYISKERWTAFIMECAEIPKGSECVIGEPDFKGIEIEVPIAYSNDGMNPVNWSEEEKEKWMENIK